MYAYTRHIRYYLALATPEQVAEGIAWYGSAAAATIEGIAEDTGLHFETVAGVVALLSPRVRWYKNIAGARRLCEAFVRGNHQPVVSGLPHNRNKAWKYLQTHSYELIRGDKVTAFYANLTGDEHPCDGGYDGQSVPQRSVSWQRWIHPADIMQFSGHISGWQRVRSGRPRRFRLSSG